MLRWRFWPFPLACISLCYFCFRVAWRTMADMAPLVYFNSFSFRRWSLDFWSPRAFCGYGLVLLYCLKRSGLRVSGGEGVSRLYFFSNYNSSSTSSPEIWLLRLRSDFYPLPSDKLISSTLASLPLSDPMISLFRDEFRRCGPLFFWILFTCVLLKFRGELACDAVYVEL